MIMINIADNGGKVESQVGESFEVRLAENPTTGYRWQLRSPVGPLLEVEDDTFAAPQAPLGAGGLRCWRFRALQQGVAPLQIENRRSWEPKPIDVFEVTIEVKAP